MCYLMLLHFHILFLFAFKQTLTNVHLDQLINVTQKPITPIPKALIIVLASMDMTGMGRLVQVENVFYRVLRD